MTATRNRKTDTPEIRYVLHPGIVESPIDADRHFITAKQLAHLYQLPPGSWVEAPQLDSPARDRFAFRPPENALHLYPRSNGNYTLPPHHHDDTNQPRQPRLSFR